MAYGSDVYLVKEILLRILTNHPDILPTIADLVGLPRQPAWQGRSLLEDGRSQLVYFYSASGRQLVGLRDGRWKLIWNRTTRTTQLFDLEEDPGETRDLTAELVNRRFLDVLGRTADDLDAEWRGWARRDSDLGRRSGW